MRNDPNSIILSQLAPEDFAGRVSELESLTEPAGSTGPGSCTVVCSAPGFGSSELLKQAFGRLFREHAAMPVYFSIERSDRTAEQCLRRFLYEVCVQAVAYGRRDARILRYSPTLDELDRLAMPSDLVWIGRVIDILREAAARDDVPSLGSYVGTALRSADAGPVTFFIDHLNETEFLADGDDLVRTFAQSTGYPNTRFIFSALRRSRSALGGKCRSIQLEALGSESLARLIETRSKKLDVAVSEHARDLIAAQMAGSPAAVVSLVRSAANRRSPLETFRQVQSVYTDELLGGGIARYFDSVLDDAAPEPETRRLVISVLHDLYWSGSGGLPIGRWQHLSGLTDAAERGLEILSTREFVNFSNGRIEAVPNSRMLADFVDARFRLEVGGGNRALVVGDSLSQFLKRAPGLMAAFYRRESALGIREILASFEAADIPAALLDYGKFSSEYKGAPDAEVLSDIGRSADRIHIPQIVQSVYTEDVYKPIGQVAERERSAVGRGFNARRYSDEEEIVWIAAEIDSKLEATRELAEFWCDRLEMAALFCDFTRFRIWLIAPEGFTPEALESLNARNAIGSSRKQTELLRTFLKGGTAHAPVRPLEEYEIVVPMGDETELVAAHAVEEIAKRHNMDPKSINQIKTALVEACINASEHSLSPDRKIYQKFAFDDEKITITISNRGLRLADRRPAADEPTGGRRGWGLALIRRLMDEVTIEDVDDGTSISMTKYLAKPA